VDEYGSSLAFEMPVRDKEMRVDVSELRSEWKFYALMTYVSTFQTAFGFPTRSCEEWERALVNPEDKENEWIVEAFIRTWAKQDGQGKWLLVPNDWQKASMEHIRRLFGQETETGFLDCDTLGRLDIMYAMIEDALERRTEIADIALQAADELERARRRRKVETERECHRHVHGEPIGYDSRGRAYYVYQPDCRVFRAEKCAIDADEGPAWSTPYVTFKEVSTFATALKKSSSKKELALYDYLINDHIPYHAEIFAAAKSAAEREAARALAAKKEEERLKAWASMERKRSSRIEKVQRATATTQDKVPEISDDEVNAHLAYLRRAMIKMVDYTAGPHFIDYHSFDIRTTYGNDRGKLLFQKPKGQKWLYKCVCVFWGDTYEEAVATDREDKWSEAVVLSHNDATGKSRIYYPESDTFEDVDLDTVYIRVGPTVPKSHVEALQSTVAESRSWAGKMLHPALTAARAAPTWLCRGWKDSIVATKGGVPAYGDGVLLLEQTISAVRAEETATGDGSVATTQADADGAQTQTPPRSEDDTANETIDERIVKSSPQGAVDSALNEEMQESLAIAVDRSDGEGDHSTDTRTVSSE
jgi:hypothetical protein